MDKSSKSEITYPIHLGRVRLAVNDVQRYGREVVDRVIYIYLSLPTRTASGIPA